MVMGELELYSLISKQLRSVSKISSPVTTLSGTRKTRTCSSILHDSSAGAGDITWDMLEVQEHGLETWDSAVYDMRLF